MKKIKRRRHTRNTKIVHGPFPFLVILVCSVICLIVILLVSQAMSNVLGVSDSSVSVPSSTRMNFGDLSGTPSSSPRKTFSNFIQYLPTIFSTIAVKIFPPLSFVPQISSQANVRIPTPTPTVHPTESLSPTPTVVSVAKRKHPVKWETTWVTIEADDFYLDMNGKKYTGEGTVSQLQSYAADPTETDFSRYWSEAGDSVRLKIEIRRKDTKWYIYRLMTYDANNKWIYYGRQRDIDVGSPWSAPSVDIKNVATDAEYGTWISDGTGTIHFENMRITAKFSNRNYAITVQSPNGGETIRKGDKVDIRWFFDNPDRTDYQTGSRNDYFPATIELWKMEGDVIQAKYPVITNKPINHFNNSTYTWTVSSSIPDGVYKIWVHANDKWLWNTKADNPYPEDTSDGTFTIQS